MKKWSLCVIIQMIMVVSFAVTAVSAPMDVVADSVSGAVEVKADGGDWQSLSSGDSVGVGSTVRTKADGSCILTWAQGNVAKVAALSIIKVSEMEKLDSGDEKSTLSLEQGKVFAHAKKLAGPDSKFELRTPTAVAGVRGTDEYATFNNGASSFGCADGAVEVTTPGGDSAVLDAGFSVGVDMSGAMGDIVPIPDDMMNEVNQNTKELKEVSKKEEAKAASQQKKEQKAAKKEEKKEEKEEKKEEKQEEKAASDESSDDEGSEETSDQDEAEAVSSDDIADVTGDVTDNIDQILDDDITDNILDDIDNALRTGTVEVEICLTSCPE